MKMTKKALQQIIEEEARKFIAEGRDVRPGMGSSPSGEDLTAAITVAIAEVFQELRPNNIAAEIAYTNIMGSIDEIFRQSYADAARASKMMGGDDASFGDLEV